MPKIPEIGAWVDEFPKRAESLCSFFLTHAHSDHCQGLDSSFSSPVFCTRLTAQLLKIIFKEKAPDTFVCCEYNVPTKVEKSSAFPAFEFEFINSNHSPGSCSIIFRTFEGVIVYAGDSRLSNSLNQHMSERSRLYSPLGIKRLHFDPTFCDSHFSFPTKEASLSALRQLLRSFDEKSPISLLFDWMGTEELVAVAVEFLHANEVIGVRSSDRLLQLKISLPSLSRRFADFSQWQGKSLPPRIFIGRHVLAASIRIKASMMWFRIRPVYENSSSTRGLVTKVRPNYYRLKWSMHSDIWEIKNLVESIKPRELLPICPRLEKRRRMTNEEVFSFLLGEEIGVERATRKHQKKCLPKENKEERLWVKKEEKPPTAKKLQFLIEETEKDDSEPEGLHKVKDRRVVVIDG
eukprot:GHVP01031486.1.p2 GENE.GHVP01031486.1~~GHVP01031486.1.p2  ORF type:complete len:406 (+),score=66.91 GHVP01031486.1:2394-3611(+)